MKALANAIAEFLADLTQASRSAHTRRAYAADLKQFQAWYSGSLDTVTPDVLRAFFAALTHLSPASRARKQAALTSFFVWAYRQALVEANPMGRVERVKLAPALPRGIGRAQVEALALYVEDLDLTHDNEHMRVMGKGSRRRTVLLGDLGVVRQLRLYLKQTGYQYGPLFRAQKNGRSGPLCYQSVQERWAGYCQLAGVKCTLHQLRHTHATELVNEGVSLATIRKRLGHKNLQTTLRYAKQADATANAEVRA